jgi:carbon-monoxide dehydrogenase medium subunit
MASGVEQALAGGTSAADAVAHAADDTEPPSDVGGSGAYRTHLAQVLTRQALERL